MNPELRRHKRNTSFLEVVRLISQLFAHLTFRRRLQFFLLLLVMIASAIAEVLSLASVFPFLSAFSGELTSSTSDQKVDTINRVIIFILGGFQYLSLTKLTFLFIGFTVLASIIRLINLWLNGMMAAVVGSDISAKVFRNILFQPYETIIGFKSSELIHTCTIHLDNLVIAFKLVLRFLTSIATFAGLLFTLFLIDLNATITIIVSSSAVYAFFIVQSKDRLIRNSRKIESLSIQKVKYLQESLGSITNIILASDQKSHIKSFYSYDRGLRITQANNIFISNNPRYLLEAISVSILALSALVMADTSNSTADVIPVLGTIALSAQKLLPVTQQIYGSWSECKSYTASFAAILKYLNMSPSLCLPLSIDSTSPSEQREPFKSLELKNVSFSYRNNTANTLSDISFTVKSGSKVLIVGSSGSGKTSLQNLMIGLLEPSSGHLLINNKAVESNYEFRQFFKNRIAHVQQNTFLKSSSILDNITSQSTDSNIDMARLIKCCQIAQIHDFIDGLPAKYQTLVGERGVNLSGGQIQRISIAQALYRQTPLIFLDEATSALDASTEAKILEAVDSISPAPTIVSITHKLSSFRNYDLILEIKDGRVCKSLDAI